MSLQTMYALVLFDIDGCTAIIDAKKFKVPDAKALCKGQQVSAVPEEILKSGSLRVVR